MIQLGWQNDELTSDRWVKIEDQPEVRVMQLTKREEDSDAGKDEGATKKREKKQAMVYCVTGLPMSKQQELVEASFQLREATTPGGTCLPGATLLHPPCQPQRQCRCTSPPCMTRKWPQRISMLLCMPERH